MPTALIELDGTASENYDNSELRYEWVQLDGPKVELSDPTAAKPYFRTGKPGLYKFQLTVTANGLKSEPFVVEIMIEQDNQPPVAVAPREVRGEVDKQISIDARQSYDPEGAPLTYRWRFLSGDPGVPPDILNQPVLSFVPQQDGVYELELVVSDGETASRPFVSSLYIRPRPRPPVAKARAIAREIPSAPQPEQAMSPPELAKPTAKIEGPAVSKIGEKVMLDARGSNSSRGNKLNYLWRQKSGPFISDFEMVFEGAAERFQPPRAGEYEFELIVSDTYMESEPAFHSLKVVNDSDPPVAVVVAPERAAPGALLKLDATQSYDLEGSPLTYKWRQTGGPKVTKYLIDDHIGDAAPAFYPPEPGTYSFELVVTNGRLQSKPVEIDIVVDDAANAPRFSIVGPQVAKTGEPFTLTAQISAPAKGGSPLVLNWRQLEGPAPSRGDPQGVDLKATTLTPGRYVFGATLLQDSKILATQKHTIEVFADNRSLSGAILSAPAAPPAATSPMPAANQAQPGSADVLTPLSPMPVTLPETLALEPLSPITNPAPYIPP